MCVCVCVGLDGFLNLSGGREHGGSIFQKAVCGIPVVELYVFLHHKDNFAIYICVTGSISTFHLFLLVTFKNHKSIALQQLCLLHGNLLQHVHES